MIRLNTTAPVIYVYPKDPAIDKDHPDYNWEEFRKTGDVKHLPAKDGEKLTIFHIKRLSRQRYIAMAEKKGLEAMEDAVKYGLTAVENLSVGDGSFRLEFKGEGRDRRLTDGCCDGLFEPGLFYDLGMRIVELSHISPLSAAD